jgi:hypothetical protein
MPIFDSFERTLSPKPHKKRNLYEDDEDEDEVTYLDKKLM